MQIKDKKVIISGGARGIGLAFVKELLRNGAHMIVVLDLLESPGGKAMQDLNNEFGRNRISFLHCDVSKNIEFQNVFKEAVSILGGLDILINNAGIVDEFDVNRTIEVNVTALIRGTFLGLHQMSKDSGSKGGIVVNISCRSGLQGFTGFPIYSASKHAVVSFSRSLAQPYHYDRSGVRIIVLCPGPTNTPILEDFKKHVIFGEDMNSLLLNLQPQKVENVAHGLIHVIRCAQNGSVWLSENGEPVYEIQLSDALPVKKRDEPVK